MHTPPGETDDVIPMDLHIYAHTEADDEPRQERVVGHVLVREEPVVEEGADDEQVGDDVYRQMRYDLCPECSRKFAASPLGGLRTKQFEFSSN